MAESSSRTSVVEALLRHLEGGHSFTGDFRADPEAARTPDRLLARSDRAVREFLGGTAAGLGEARTVAAFERELAEVQLPSITGNSPSN